MRTAVLRVNIDPDGELTAADLAAGMAALGARVEALGGEVLDAELGAAPPTRREVQVLLETESAEADTARLVDLCAEIFGIAPVSGVITYVSRGTDEDARGVLAGFGLTGEVVRIPGDDGYDIVEVKLRAEDLERIPESRIHTALEASLNAEVRIRPV